MNYLFNDASCDFPTPAALEEATFYWSGTGVCNKPPGCQSAFLVLLDHGPGFYPNCTTNFTLSNRSRRAFAYSWYSYRRTSSHVVCMFIGSHSSFFPISLPSEYSRHISCTHYTHLIRYPLIRSSLRCLLSLQRRGNLRSLEPKKGQSVTTINLYGFCGRSLRAKEMMYAVQLSWFCRCSSWTDWSMVTGCCVAIYPTTQA